jgi:3-oxoadipate enol-lactonase
MVFSEKNIITGANITVSYTDEGKNEAPAVIFIHGFPFNKSMWNKQVEALVDNYRVIAYDIRGHGNTHSGSGDFSIELFVKDLLSLIDVLKIDKTIVCGLSMGGYIALNAIENYPGRFNALVLSDTNCIADTPETKEKRTKSIDNIMKNGVENYADESIKNLFAPESFVLRKKEVDEVREMIVKTSEQSLCNTLLALSLRKETCSKLHEINVPTLILVGKEDKITSPEAAHFMNEKINNSSLSIIDHAAHLSNMENAGEFNIQLRKFIENI